MILHSLRHAIQTPSEVHNKVQYHIRIFLNFSHSIHPSLQSVGLQISLTLDAQIPGFQICSQFFAYKYQLLRLTNRSFSRRYFSAFVGSEMLQTAQNENASLSDLHRSNSISASVTVLAV